MALACRFWGHAFRFESRTTTGHHYFICTRCLRAEFVAEPSRPSMRVWVNGVEQSSSGGAGGMGGTTFTERRVG